MPGGGKYVNGVPPGDVGHIGGAGAACTIAATLFGSSWAQASAACRQASTPARAVVKRASCASNFRRACSTTCSRRDRLRGLVLALLPQHRGFSAEVTDDRRQRVLGLVEGRGDANLSGAEVGLELERLTVPAHAFRVVMRLDSPMPSIRHGPSIAAPVVGTMLLCIISAALADIAGARGEEAAGTVRLCTDGSATMQVRKCCHTMCFLEPAWRRILMLSAPGHTDTRP